MLLMLHQADPLLNSTRCSPGFTSNVAQLPSAASTIASTSANPHQVAVGWALIGKVQCCHSATCNLFPEKTQAAPTVRYEAGLQQDNPGAGNLLGILNGAIFIVIILSR
jgi:hypothetical protein